MDHFIIKFDTNSQRLKGWLAIKNNETVGHCFMLIEPENKIKFLDAWVDENHRREGIYRSLWEARWKYAEENYKGCLAYAWCKSMSLPLLLEKGFEEGDICTYVDRVV